MQQQNEPQKLGPQEIAKEVFIIRPTTTTRPVIKLTVTQRVTDDGEIAMSTSIFSQSLPVYYEKPDILEDIAMEMIRAAGVMRRLNKKVRNGK